MGRYPNQGTGTGNLYPSVGQPLFGLPQVFRPMLVQVEGDRLWAPPSTQPIVQPPPGAWLNFATDTNPKDVGTLRAIAAEWGPLTREGADESKGEPQAVWRDLIRELRQLAGAWTKSGEEAARNRKVQVAVLAMQVQNRLVAEHQKEGGTFASFGAGGFGMVTLEMAQWWRLSALASVYAEASFKRCRFCGCWFTMQGRRGDAGFCSERHRNYFHQGVKIPPAMGWWGLV